MTKIDRKCRETTVKIDRPNLLFVEGEQDRRFFEAFASHLAIADCLRVIAADGKHGFTGALRVAVKDPGFPKVRSATVALDADDDWRRAFQSACTALQNAGLEPPPEPWMLSDADPRTAVLVLPGKGRNGELEDLCLESVSDDPAMLCVDGFVKCVKASCGRSQPRNWSKCRTQVFLASRERPELRLAEAAESGYWPWEADAFSELRQFLLSLPGTTEAEG